MIVPRKFPHPPSITVTAVPEVLVVRRMPARSIKLPLPSMAIVGAPRFHGRAGGLRDPSPASDTAPVVVMFCDPRSSGPVVEIA